MTGRKPRERLPSPEQIRRDLRDIYVACGELAKRYEEAYDAALTRGGGGHVETSGRGWAGFEDKDPTGETAVVSWDPRHIRSAVRYVPGAIGRAAVELERATERLQSAFLDTDPDLRADRLEKRQAAVGSGE